MLHPACSLLSWINLADHKGRAPANKPCRFCVANSIRTSRHATRSSPCASVPLVCWTHSVQIIGPPSEIASSRRIHSYTRHVVSSSSLATAACEGSLVKSSWRPGYSSAFPQFLPPHESHRLSMVLWK